MQKDTTEETTQDISEDSGDKQAFFRGDPGDGRENARGPDSRDDGGDDKVCIITSEGIKLFENDIIDYLIQAGYKLLDIKSMTLNQFLKSLKAVDKRIRITTGDLYQDEVTPEGELRQLAKIFTKG
ncbi:unnamed protein product [marine sediment metagenome]|uniref:Uncharacterized protein n=1 Tax=marine sediment metagenome TaxID=412755 RepID=X1KBN5_9ZZZZ